MSPLTPPAGEPVREAVARWRKKPVEIEAFRLGEAWPDWWQEKHATNEVTTHNNDGRWDGGPDYALIRTLEGVMRADKGDWIIRGVKGELYPCKPYIFVATYEPALAQAQNAPQPVAPSEDQIFEAIEKARCPDREGPYGLYDYSSYGDRRPHHVRDFRDPKSPTWGHSVYIADNEKDARAEYDRLTREHIAPAVMALYASVPTDSAEVAELKRECARLERLWNYAVQHKEAAEARAAKAESERDDYKDDSLRLHKDKCDALDRERDKDTETARLTTYVARLTKALDDIATENAELVRRELVREGALDRRDAALARSDKPARDGDE